MQGRKKRAWWLTFIRKNGSTAYSFSFSFLFLQSLYQVAGVRPLGLFYENHFNLFLIYLFFFYFFRLWEPYDSSFPF